MDSAPSPTPLWEKNEAFRAAVVAEMLTNSEYWCKAENTRYREQILHEATYGRWYDIIRQFESMALNTDTLRTVAILLYEPKYMPRRIHHPLPEEVNHHDNQDQPSRS